MGLILTYSFLLKNKFAIDEQQTFDSLKAQAYVSPADDPFYSVFTIANNGTQEIGKHRIGCHVNLVTGQHGGFLRNFNEIVTEFNTNLEPGGDADSSECLQAVVPADASAYPSCLDITVWIEYSFADYPEKKVIKNFRFWSFRNGGRYQWYRKPVDSPLSYCQPFLVGH